MSRGRLNQVLGELEQEGTLEPDQRQIVGRRLEEALYPRHDPSGGLVRVISILGVILISAGVHYFVASNWEQLGKLFKLLLLFGVVLASHSFGFRLGLRPGRYPKTGTALTALGVLTFGLAIILIAQIYHLHSDHPHFMLAWWVLGLPFAFMIRSRFILLLLILLCCGWAVWQTGSWLESRNVGDDANTGAAFSLLGLSAAALFRVLAGLARESRHHLFETPLRLFVVPAAFAGVYALSFREAFLPEDAPGVGTFAFYPAAILLLAMLAASGFLLRRRETRSDFLDACGYGLTAAVLGASAYFWPAGTFVLANVLLFLGLMALVARGVQRGLPLLINFGIAGFLALIMTRYFEYLADHLDNAVLAFIVPGILLLFLGLFLERRRRAFLARAGESSR
ncbi:MAG: DUF2157 domain-containing protein [Planctomycetota bacterium]